MSSLCLCIINGIEIAEKNVFVPKVELLAQNYKCNVDFCINWCEPILSDVKQDSFIVNIIDSSISKNCELFLLPDNWWFNGQTNKVGFRERIKLLEDIAGLFDLKKHSINIYLAESGTALDEFVNVSLKRDEISDYLTQTIGAHGIIEGIHINIIQ